MPLKFSHVMKIYHGAEEAQKHGTAIQRSAQASKAPTLHLTQCAAAAHERDRANGRRSGQGLEQVPRCVVEEEDALEREKRAQKHSVRQRRGLECGGQVVEVGAEVEPLQRLAGHSCDNSDILTRPARIGRAAPTMATQASVMMIAGFEGASLKTWWISGSLP